MQILQAEISGRDSEVLSPSSKQGFAVGREESEIDWEIFLTCFLVFSYYCYLSRSTKPSD